MAATHDTDAFLDAEIEDRRELGYPPFSRLALVRLEATDAQQGRLEAQRLCSVARQAAPAGVRVLGPSAAPLARLRGRYRFHFLVQAGGRGPLRSTLQAVARAAENRRVRVGIDVDPMNML
jgi:primosomal protein N' (replication factor Y)